MRGSKWAAAALAAAIGLSACGGGGKGSDEDPRAALEAAVRAYSDAYLSGNGPAAHALLSARCQQRVSEAELTQLTGLAKTTYGQLPIQNLTIDQLSGSLAQVTYTYGVPALNQTSEPWAQEAGQWREDDC